jgi:exonuclease SbcD
VPPTVAQRNLGEEYEVIWRFIHAADVHLDSPMLNLYRYEGAPVEHFRGAARKAVDNLVELALAQQARFVLFAGDLYDGECRDINTAIALRNRLRELAQHGIASFIVQGNHDAASRVTKAFRLELPEGAHLLPTSHPGTIKLDDLRVAIHGQGFETSAVVENLSAGYPEPVPGFLNIGLLHTNCGGVGGHDNYAPSSVDSLRAKGYQYWALGHIHEHAVLHREDPWIVYPGNLQGRSVREIGAKGCCLITVEDSHVADVEHRPVDVVRWVRCKIDVSACADGGSAVAAVARQLTQEVSRVGDRLLAVRVELTGASAAHRPLSVDPWYWQQQLREMAVDRFGERVWIEKIRFDTRLPVDLSEVDSLDDALGELLRELRDLDRIDDLLAEVGPELEQMRAVLPSDPRLAGGTMPDLNDAGTRMALLHDVKQLLISRLLEGREDW